jgi:Ca2+-binding EF-hand superfamily protein
LFKFIDPSNYGRVKLPDLKKKVSLFARELRGNDYKLLMTGKNEMSISELHDILKNNELDNFDPIREAFRFFDPDNTGSVDMERLREIFLLLGYGELSYADLNLLLEIADKDGDHKISLDDFRELVPMDEEEEVGEDQGGFHYSVDPEIHAVFKDKLKTLLQ